MTRKPARFTVKCNLAYSPGNVLWLIKGCRDICYVYVDDIT